MLFIVLITEIQDKHSDYTGATYRTFEVHTSLSPQYSITWTQI